MLGEIPHPYTAGNTVNNVDPQGTLLQVAYSNGGTDAQLSIALAYLAGSSQYIGDLAQLIASPYQDILEIANEIKAGRSSY